MDTAYYRRLPRPGVLAVIASLAQVFLLLLAVSLSHSVAVASAQTSSYLFLNTGSKIVRYNGTTGTLIDTIIPRLNSGAWPADFAVGPDGNLYVIRGLAPGAYTMVMRGLWTEFTAVGVFKVPA